MTEHAPLFVLRVAGLPISSVHRLRCPDSIAWANEILRREEQLSAGGAALSELLHSLVKSNEDERSRRRLLELRRQVFRSAAPPNPTEVLELLSTMDRNVAGMLSTWLAHREALAVYDRVEVDVAAISVLA